MSMPVPAVLLIGGSGGDDRYECSEAGAAGATVCTFYDVVRAITGAGSAALVYDKRTCNYIADFQGGAPGRADLFPCARPCVTGRLAPVLPPPTRSAHATNHPLPPTPHPTPGWSKND